MIIGKIVKSNSHIDYVCHIYGRNEVEPRPAPEDYAFGRFVRVQTGASGGRWIVGVIYNTILVNPEYGSFGPRLSSQPELEVFSPDYLDERATLVGLIVLGYSDEESGIVHHGICPVALSVDAEVETMSEEQIVAFHRRDSSLNVGYYPHLIGQNNSVIPHLLLKILEELEGYFPDNRDILAVLKDNLAWKSKVQLVG
ncbi:MAG: hypothetical protein M1358_15420 [Chloroflexi bacterium]|nr:hypothetical protein [Chloroflexota bacterium]